MQITIDIEQGTLEALSARIETTFPLDEFTRARLVNGWDDIGLTLRYEDEIEVTSRPGPRGSPIPAESRADLLSPDRSGRSGSGLRARRVPGADYHEGQGGSQRRGTRSMISCQTSCSSGNCELVRRLVGNVSRLSSVYCSCTNVHEPAPTDTDRRALKAARCGLASAEVIPLPMSANS